MLNGGRTISRVARDLDLTETSLREWVCLAEIERGEGPPDALTKVELEELVRLRRDVKRRVKRSKGSGRNPSDVAAATPSGRACAGQRRSALTAEQSSRGAFMPPDLVSTIPQRAPMRRHLACLATLLCVLAGPQVTPAVRDHPAPDARSQAAPMAVPSGQLWNPALLQSEADRLVHRVGSPERRSAPPTAASGLDWTQAHAGSPLAVCTYPSENPSGAIVPVLAPSDRVVGWIGLDVATCRWRWFRGAEGVALTSPDEARMALRRQTATTPGIDTAPLRLLRMPDRRLYWHLAWTDPAGTRRERFVDLGDPTRILTERTRSEAEKLPFTLPAPLEQELHAPGIDAPAPDGPPIRPATTRSTELNDTPAGCTLEVPHHYQRTSYNCGPASLQMVFGDWGAAIDQADIAKVAHTTISAGGTARLDLRRAGHFSHLSAAYGTPTLIGYAARPLGFASIPANWETAPNYQSRYEDLKRLVCEGYPMILLTWYDETFDAGHYRVLKGYDDGLGVFVVHDPWYTPPYQGPDLFLEQSFLVDTLWPYQNGRYWGLFVAPWIVSVSAPDTVEMGRTFTVSAAVT